LTNWHFALYVVNATDMNPNNLYSRRRCSLATRWGWGGGNLEPHGTRFCSILYTNTVDLRGILVSVFELG